MLRLANPYGPRGQIRHSKYCIVNFFIRKALEGQEIMVFGDGKQVRDYIDDLVDAYLAVATSERTVGEVYNVGSGRGISFAEMARTVVRITGNGAVKHVKWSENYLSVETGDYVSDIGKITTHTGWTPHISFEEGIARTIAYYRPLEIRLQYMKENA